MKLLWIMIVSHYWAEWKTKRKLYYWSCQEAVHVIHYLGCAAILNWFLVAPLFHYLIGKKGFTPRCVSTTRSGTEWSMSTILHIQRSEVAVLFLFVLQLVFFPCKIWSCGVFTACSPVHVSLLLVEQEESLCGAAYSGCSPPLNLALCIFLIVSTRCSACHQCEAFQFSC